MKVDYREDPAFPCHGSMGEVVNSGMTLRDYFAAAAVPLVATRAEIDHTGPEDWAAALYQIADAMLAKRAK